MSNPDDVDAMLELAEKLDLKLSPSQVRELLQKALDGANGDKRLTAKLYREEVIGEKQDANKEAKAKTTGNHAFEWVAKGKNREIHFKVSERRQHLCIIQEPHLTHICVDCGCGFMERGKVEGEAKKAAFIPARKRRIEEKEEHKIEDGAQETPKLSKAEMAGLRDREKDMKNLKQAAKTPFACRVQKENGKGECGMQVMSQEYLLHLHDKHPAEWALVVKKSQKKNRAKVVSCKIPGCTGNSPKSGNRPHTSIFTTDWMPAWHRHMQTVHGLGVEESQRLWDEAQGIKSDMEATEAKGEIGGDLKPKPPTLTAKSAIEEQVPAQTRATQATQAAQVTQALWTKREIYEWRENLVFQEIARNPLGINIHSIARHTNLTSFEAENACASLLVAGKIKAKSVGGGPRLYFLREKKA